MAGVTQENRGQWYTLRTQAKDRWGQLTNDDLCVQDGNVAELADRIQSNTGEGCEAIEDVLSDVPAPGVSAVSQATEAAGQLAHPSGERASVRCGSVEDRARQNPTRLVLLIFGLGLVAGLIVGQTLRRR